MKRIIAITLFLSFLFISARSASAQVHSIPEFLDQKAKWPRLIGTSWRLEGRYAVIFPNGLRFKKCDLPFRFDPGINKPPSGSSVIEVSGKLAKEDGEIVFRISSIRSRPTDQETLTAMRAEIDSSVPEDWHELANWAKKRGTFYADPLLMKKVYELNQQGILTAKRRIQSGEYQALDKLTNRAIALKMEPGLIRSMQHESLRMQYDLIKDQEKQAGELPVLLTAIGKKLPASRTKLKTFPAALEERYRKGPVLLYSDSEPSIRDQLDRLFYIDVSLARIESQARPNGSNGNAIAAMITKEIPERTDLIEKYELLELEYQFERINAMTRQEMLDFAQNLIDRKMEERAVTVKQQWIKAREPLLSQDGARGYCELAEEWLSLLDDHPAAVKAYIMAWKHDPSYQHAIKGLRDEDMVLQNKKWIRRIDMKPTVETELEKAAREGRILVGMTASQVQTALGTKPTHIIRMAAIGKTTELWVFDATNISIRLSRRSHEKNSTVTKIERLAK